MTISELKEYIYSNNKIQDILEELGCHNIKYNERRQTFSASFPDGDNPQGINIRNNEYLNYRSFSRGVDYEDGKDLISLVEDIKKINFVNSIKLLYQILDLSFEFKRKEEKPKKKYDPLDVFKKVLKCNRSVINVDDIKVLDEEILNDYIPMLHIDWYREGIMPWTREKFGLCYSYKHKRIIIPIRYWLTGELIATNARTTVENWKEFDIKKYVLTSGYNKQLNLYGLYENYKDIQKAGYVTIYESEKSVLKRDSLCDSTGVALSGHTMSEEQVNILWGLNVEVIIAMDNDIREEEIWHMCEKFWRGRKVSYIKDDKNILSAKDSPADAKTNKDFQYLFDNRIVYDREQHKKYLESLRKK